MGACAANSGPFAQSVLPQGVRCRAVVAEFDHDLANDM